MKRRHRTRTTTERGAHEIYHDAGIQESKMTVMKIGDFDVTGYSDASLFSFPENPNTVNIPLTPNRTFRPVPYSMKHIVTGGGGTNPKDIVLSGTLHGDSKRTNFNTVAGHINEEKVKRFYISDTRFYYWLGGVLRESLAGERTNFIDYVATLRTPIPFCYSDTEKWERWTRSAVGGETQMNAGTSDSQHTGQFSNSGNAPSFVKWVIQNNGVGNITQIEIGDSSPLSNAVHTIDWTGTLAPTGILTIYVFKYLAEVTDFHIMRYNYPELQTSEIELGSRKVTREMPWVSAGATDQTFGVKITGASSGNATIHAYWRDAYLS